MKVWTLGLALVSASFADLNVAFEVDLLKDAHPISPWIYGTNTESLGGNEGVTFMRSGGNRLTGYNWENNASNAGTDWYNNSDNLMGGGETPGKSMADFHESALKAGARSIITLPAAGYVAKDKSGGVGENETAPSARWAKLVFRKNAPFANPPDAADGAVYMDEFVDFMAKKFGNAASTDGVKFYDVDNEPGLWASTHPRLHPAKTRCLELTARNADLSAAVKRVDPGAEIFGGVFYGYNDFASLQDAPDWDSIKTAAAKAGHPYGWYIDFFLEEMRKASEKDGRRLLDVLDIHWYSEAAGDHRVNDTAATTAKDQKARMQAPRSLWDSSYVEDSWISKWQTPKQPVTDWGNPTPGPVSLLPHLRASIAKYYPGTKVSVTEFNYGGNKHVSGGLATADFLGIMGREGIYASAYWELGDGAAYAGAAYRLFRNYDGAKSAFGSISARAEASDRENASLYASYDPGASELHLIALNKSQSETVNGTFHVASPAPLTQGKAWGFDGTGTAVKEKTAVPVVSGNTFSYALPPLTAWHFVIKTSSALPNAVRFPSSGAVGPMGKRPGYLPDGRWLESNSGAPRARVPFWLRSR
jgi:mannan endo-1,4-beta-mannosidase